MVLAGQEGRREDAGRQAILESPRGRIKEGAPAAASTIAVSCFLVLLLEACIVAYDVGVIFRLFKGCAVGVNKLARHIMRTGTAPINTTAGPTGVRCGVR